MMSRLHQGSDLNRGVKKNRIVGKLFLILGTISIQRLLFHPNSFLRSFVRLIRVILILKELDLLI